MTSHDATVLECRDLRLHYPIRSGLLRRRTGAVRAVDGVSLSVRSGQTLALVGESGCGKSSLARALLHLERPTGGTVHLDGRRVGGDMPIRSFRRHVQAVFQNPYASLDPRMSIGASIAEPLRAFRLGDSAQRRRRVGEVLEQVGLQPGDARRYPHQFSGGQRQRIAIARAIAPSPQFIICDEAVSALDASVQAQIVTLLRQLQHDLGLAYLFVSHDLGIVRQLAHDVAVMYLGRIVETAPVEQLFGAPSHPYTHALISAVPIADPDLERSREQIILTGRLPSPADPPPGCHFHTRCPIAQQVCAGTEPVLEPSSEHRSVACHFPLTSAAIPAHPLQAAHIEAMKPPMHLE